MGTELADMAGRIRSLHGQLVMLDVDLNDMRNLEPTLEDPGVDSARSTWLAYTEHGVLVAGDALDDPRAVQQSIHLVRAFVAKRERAESKQGTQPQEWLH